MESFRNLKKLRFGLGVRRCGRRALVQKLRIGIVLFECDEMLREQVSFAR